MPPTPSTDSPSIPCLEIASCQSCTAIEELRTVDARELCSFCAAVHAPRCTDDDSCAYSQGESCTRDEGEACEVCARKFAADMAMHRASYDAATPEERAAVIHPSQDEDPDYYADRADFAHECFHDPDFAV